MLRRILLLTVVLSVLSLAFLGSGTPAQADGPNLLQNGGFENPYVPMPNKENCRIASSWVPWWVQGSPDQNVQGYLLAPEYKAAFRSDFPGNRVRNGELSQQYFHSFGNFQGGVWQQVSNVPVGAWLRFDLSHCPAYDGATRTRRRPSRCSTAPC